jgi:hypothetical protein
LAPKGLVEVPRTELPSLGDIEFVVMEARAARNGPAQALAAMIQASGVLLRNPISTSARP